MNSSGWWACSMLPGPQTMASMPISWNWPASVAKARPIASLAPVRGGQARRPANRGAAPAAARRNRPASPPSPPARARPGAATATRPERFDLGDHARRLDGRDRAEFPADAAMARNDIDRAAALDLADIERGIGRVEAIIEGALAPVALGDAIEEANDLRGMADRIHAPMGRARMAVATLDLDLEAVAALMPVAELEARRFADDDDRRLRRLAAISAIMRGAPRQPISSS